jgi:hypothetical protein
MPQLLTYNAFGLVTVTRTSITVNVTAIAGQRAVSRTATEETGPIQGIQPGEVAKVSFGAWIEPTKDTRLTFHEHDKLQSGDSSIDIPKVNEIISKALKMVKSSVFA